MSTTGRIRFGEACFPGARGRRGWRHSAAQACGRERLVRHVDALRAHLAEFGIVAPLGLRNVGKLIAIVRDEADAR